MYDAVQEREDYAADAYYNDEPDVAPLTTERAEKLDELVRSGGYPYIKITLVDPENGGVEIMHHGLKDDVDLPRAFRELADLVESQA